MCSTAVACACLCVMIGVAINMLHDDKSRMQLKAIAQHFNRDVAELPVNNIEEIDKRVKAALQ